MNGLLQAALEHHRSGHLGEASEVYREILCQSPDHPDALHLLGVALHQLGDHLAAADLIGRAIALRPDEPDYHADLAEVWRALGRPDRAADSGRAALRLRPDHPGAANNLGLALLQSGDAAGAADQFRAVLALRPQFAAAHNNLADALRTLGDAAAAEEHFRAAVRLDPGLAEAHANLGQLLLERGQRAVAVDHCREAVRLRPDLPAAHCNLGNALRELSRHDEAYAHYAEALRLAPAVAAIHENLGRLLQERGRFDEALAAFRRAVELEPGSPGFLCRVGGVLAEAGRHEEAVGQYEAALRLDPRSAEALLGLGLIEHDRGRGAAAAGHFLAAADARPDFVPAHCGLGTVLQEVNDMPGAEAAFRTALRHDPSHPAALAELATLLRGRLPDADLTALRERAAAPHLRPAERAGLLFGLSQVLDARWEYEAAAAALVQANHHAGVARRARGEHYDPPAHTRFVSDVLAACSPAFFDRVRGLGAESDRPVFVFGLPRSGTTLVEQMLAGHSRVFGAGELRLAREGFESLPAVTNAPGPPAACLGRLDRRAIDALARRHLDRLSALGGGAVRVVDKMPDNYLLLGLLAAVFPRARFVHCRRDLRDVAVSCWMTHFRQIRWADDPAHIAARFADYRRAAGHWRAALPVQVLEVTYEEVVADPEGQARRLVEWCGLDWEPGCLDVHTATRPVRTASVTQVRQPVHARSVARWRHYEPHLRDLFERLVAVAGSGTPAPAGR